MQWVKCTAHKNGEPIYVNVANAMSVAPGRKGGTVIAFPGGKKDYVVVAESPEDLLAEDAKHHHAGGKSCPCGSRATADHASS
jgi:hypothetical protein